MFFAPAGGAEWACNTLQELPLPGLSSEARGKHSRACSADRVGSTPEVLIIEALSLGGYIAKACTPGLCCGRLYPAEASGSFHLGFIGCKDMRNWEMPVEIFQYLKLLHPLGCSVSLS